MQHCSLIMKKRKRGPDIWLLRWSDKSDSGRRIYHKRVIGTVEEFVDADSARERSLPWSRKSTAIIHESAFARYAVGSSAAISNDASWHKETPGAATLQRNVMRDI